MKLSKLIAGVAIATLGLLVFVAPTDAQLPQHFSNISVNDYAVVNDSTADSVFSISSDADVDSSIAYDAYLWHGVTVEAYSNSGHADSAGVSVLLMGSIRGTSYALIDTIVAVTADETATFGSVDLRASRYRYIELHVHGIASTGNAGQDGGPNEPVVNLRMFRWGDR